jgi:hypothetical protein
MSIIPFFQAMNDQEIKDDKILCKMELIMKNAELPAFSDKN